MILSLQIQLIYKYIIVLNFTNVLLSYKKNNRKSGNMIIVTLMSCIAIYISGYHVNYLYNNPEYKFKRVKNYNSFLYFFGEKNINVLKVALNIQKFAIISFIFYFILIIINTTYKVPYIKYYPFIIVIVHVIYLFIFLIKFNFYKYIIDKNKFIKDNLDAISIDLELLIRKKVQIINTSDYIHDKKIHKKYCLCTVKVLKSKKIISNVACFIEDVKVGNIYKMYHFRSKETYYHYVIANKI